MFFGDVVRNAETALKIGRILAEDLWGIRDLQQQEPIRIESHGDYWHVIGSRERGDKPQGDGPIFIKLRKADCKIMEIFRVYQIEPPSEVKKIMESNPSHRRREEGSE
jgi:hypothetical protein